MNHKKVPDKVQIIGQVPKKPLFHSRSTTMVPPFHHLAEPRPKNVQTISGRGLFFAEKPRIQPGSCCETHSDAIIPAQQHRTAQKPQYFLLLCIFDKNIIEFSSNY